MCLGLSELREAMKWYAESFDAALVSATDAARVVDHASAIEKMAAAVKAAAAARMDRTEVWKKEGDRSAAHHLARKTGSSVGQAQSALETACRLEKLPAASAAARRGELSPAQASAIANAATADPAAEQRLVEKAAKASLSDLRDECARTKAAADPDLEARRRRIHANRCVRRWSDEEGVGHLHWSDNPEVIAAFSAVLDPIVEEKFAVARAEGRRERHEAYAADAMAEMARRAASPTSAGTGDDTEGARAAAAPRPARSRLSDTKVIVRIDFGALFRGYPTTGEVCEIVGFGPVAVSAIRDIIDSGNAFLAAVITKGEQVLGVAHLGRRPPAAVKTALQWIHPRCANEACPNMARLEYDHREPWADTHITTFDTQDRLCDFEHDLKTRKGWSLVEGHGRRAFVSPDDPRHPRNKSGGGATDARPPPAADNDPPEAA